jgi:hypothetical protein
MKAGFVVSLAAALALMSFGAGGAQALGAGKTCGGFLGLPCDDGLFCQQKAGTCGRFDLTGVCTKIPKFCGKFVLPVCGCNNVTYNNGCEAEQARVSIAHKGVCK